MSNIKKYWLVYVGKREYKLTEAQYNFIQKESKEKGTTIFWFDKFVISLPHVSSMDFVQETVQGVPEITPVEKKASAEMKAKLKQNLQEKLKKLNEVKNKEIEQRKTELRKQAESLN
jgi:hypothetical protein